MLKGSAYVLGLRILGEGLGLVMVMLAGNFYSVEATGLLLTLQNNLFLFGTFGTIGLGTCFLRFAPGELSAGRLDGVRGLIRWVLGIATAGLATAAVMHTIFMCFSDNIGLGWGQLSLAGLAIIAWGWVTLGRHLLRALQMVFWSEISYQVIRPLGGVVILITGLFIGAPLLIILPALLLPLLLGILHDMFWVKKLVGDIGGAANLEQRPIWRRTAMDFGLFNLARVTMQRLDLLIVSTMLGLEAAAVYGLATRLAFLAAIAVDPIQSMFQPRAARHHAENNQAAMQRDVVIGGLWIFVVSIGVAVLFPLTSPWWIQLFGTVAQDAALPSLLAILVVGNAISANSSTAAGVLLMTGGQSRLARLNSVTIFLIFPPVLLLGILAAGIWGAALATLAARLAVSATAVVLAYRQTGTVIVPRPTSENLRIAFGPLLMRLRRRS